MAKPKLALIPAAQGSKFYSVLPSSGVGDFTFTRSGSATRINSQGLIETVANGVSRLNYPLIDGKVVGCPSHLLEPASTNLITYSEDFSNAYWVKNSSTVTSGFMSPDGTLNAYKIIANANNSATAHSIYHNPGFSITSGLDYTATAYLKYDNQQYARFEFGSTGGMGIPLSQRSVVVDLINGTINTTVSPAKATIKKFTGGFYEVSLTTTPAASGVTSSGISFTDASGNNIITNGNESIIAFGIQAENLSYATSYIKTTNSVVTRSAETANNSGDAATFNDSEGVLMAEISALVDDNSFRYISISDGTSSNTIRLYYTSTSNSVTYQVRFGGSLEVLSTVTVNDITNYNKIAVKWKLNDFSIFINGLEVATDTSGNTPIGLNLLQFTDANGTSSSFYGNTKQIQYYDSALTDSELETLTSWVSFSDMANGQLYTIE